MLPGSKLSRRRGLRRSRPTVWLFGAPRLRSTGLRQCQQQRERCADSRSSAPLSNILIFCNRRRRTPILSVLPTQLKASCQLLLQLIQRPIARQYLLDAGVRLAAFADGGKEFAVLQFDAVH